MSDGLDADAMVTVAALVSRVEALVVASMLEAAGIQVMVGGAGHASVEVYSLALGGHRLWVPALQHEAASEVLREVFGEEMWAFNQGLQQAVLRFAGVWAALWTAWALIWWSLGQASLSWVLAAPFNALTIPVNPQGRGDYYLVASKD
jgi:Putative prokaryotic signal transducing protein